MHVDNFNEKLALFVGGMFHKHIPFFEGGAPQSNGANEQHGPDARQQDDAGVPITQIYHPYLNSKFCNDSLISIVWSINTHKAAPCNSQGHPLLPNTASHAPDPDPGYREWWPYENCVEFETTDLLFTHDQMPASKIDDLLKIWAAILAPHNDSPPFKDHNELYSIIDATPLPDGNTEWQTFNLCYCSDDIGPNAPGDDIPNWKKMKWDVWYHNPCQLIYNMLLNSNFCGEFNYAPHQEHNLDGNHCFHNMMSGNWCWHEAVSVYCFLIYLC